MTRVRKKSCSRKEGRCHRTHMGFQPKYRTRRRFFGSRRAIQARSCEFLSRRLFRASYVKDRILTLERCPDGLKGQCFYQKEKPEGMPPGTPTKRIANLSGKRKSTNYIVGGSLETQIALVNLGCIPVHVTGSRAKAFPKPDWICFDLDPGSGKFSDAAEAGCLLKELLDKLHLKSFPKTSGSRGLHVFVPVRVGPTADEILKFA